MSFMRKFLGLAVLATCALLLANLAPVAHGQGDLLVTYNGTVKRIGVSVVSSSPELTALMQGAFRIHGAFDVVPESQANYVLRFDQAGSGRVSVSVEPKIAGGQAIQTTGTGSDWRQAAYRAADAVVEKLTPYPGFFAGKLLFVLQKGKARELGTSDLLGKDGLQLTTDNSTSVHPRWSADGTKFLYTGYYKSGFPDIIQYNLITKTKTTFAHFQGTNTGAVYSPDGKSVAMLITYNGTPQLYVSDADGKNLHRLTSSVTLKSSPTWSPDSKHIIFSMDPGPQLYQISASGGSVQLVSARLPTYCADASWNPRDADRVAFMEQEPGGEFRIAVATLSSHSTQVFDNAIGEKPCWANDGRHIIFTHHEKSGDMLEILDTVTMAVKILPTVRGASDASFYYPGK